MYGVEYSIDWIALLMVFGINGIMFIIYELIFHAIKKRINKPSSYDVTAINDIQKLKRRINELEKEVRGS